MNTWNYIDEGRQARHMGPFSEDFWNAFHLGDDPRGIGHLDIDGVNFAGVKALDARTTAQDERIRQLEAQVAELQRMVQALTAAQRP
ncbi:MAG TPA: hypothetical protein VJT67_15700 [Longimicrobiaceae bacterium]|nr:hypothetical protein [Longimicrobiaceae bacterium]